MICMLIVWFWVSVIQFLYIWQYVQFYYHAEAASIVKFSFSSPLLVLEWKLNLMAHGEAREEKCRGKRQMEWVASTHALYGNTVYPALLPLMRTPRLPAADWTDTSTNMNGLVRFARRPNLVSARVPSHSISTLQSEKDYFLMECTTHSNIFGVLLGLFMICLYYWMNSFMISFFLWLFSPVCGHFLLYSFHNHS